jgi:3-deoxy-D-arabino-heptulosonate 7-phosphate (DAHP) synthase class II
MDPSDLVSMISAFNPENTPGRLAIVVRMGADKLRSHLPALVSAVQSAGQVVTWVCDPMHGNTESCNGYKTRRYDKVRPAKRSRKRSGVLEEARCGAPQGPAVSRAWAILFMVAE